MKLDESDQQREHRWWSSIPRRLRNRPQWVMTKEKAPVEPSVGWNDPEEQLTFDQALKLSEEQDGEPAYVLRADDPFVIIDLDDIGPPHSISKEVEALVRDFCTYTEASRSRTGLHLVASGTRLPNRTEKGDLHGQGRIEVFDSNRYVVLTGDQIERFDTITGGEGMRREDTDVLTELQREYLPERTAAVDASQADSIDISSTGQVLGDIRVPDIRSTLQEYSEVYSESAQRVLDYWQSSAGSSLRFSSPSEADYWFVCDLAFWCREDARLIDDCFRSSRRMRQKWDEVHYADGRTYGEGTIQTAIRKNHDTFAGHYVIQK